MALNKRNLIIGLIWILPQALSAQNAQEWTKQRQTQVQYLVQQIAALRIYLDYLKGGYDIVKKGLNFVGDIKEGNFNDHTIYFNSLGVVSSVVKDSEKLSLIAKYQSKILIDFEELSSETTDSEYLSMDEKGYVDRVRNGIITECENILDELRLTITNHSLEMTDDERLKRVDRIYDQMKFINSFTNSFCSSVEILIHQRVHEAHEIEKSALLLNISQP
jgi:hypothetical protein